MGKLITIFVVVILMISLFVAIGKFHLSKDAGYQRFQTCEQIRNKIERQELIKMVGEPYHIEKTQSSVVYYYQAAMFAAGPIRIMLDNQEAMVIGVKCSEDGEWKSF